MTARQYLFLEGSKVKTTPAQSDAGDRQAASPETSSASRRKFLGRVGMATVAAGLLGKTGVAFAQSANAEGATANGQTPPDSRVQHALNLRTSAAQRDSLIAIPPHTTNGDEQRYAD